MLRYRHARQFGLLRFDSLEVARLVKGDADVVRRENREFVRRDVSGF